MPTFQFRGYITRVFSDKKIKIRIEEDDKEKVSSIFSTLYKSKKEYNEINVLLTSTLLDIQNLEYVDLKDLIGVYVYVHGYTKYYSFTRQEETGDTKMYKGYNVHATKMRNYTM
jgi:hypothetical protein